MATEIKLRRGTTAEHASFTGVQGEITVDTDLNTIRVHDGQTASGHRVLLHSEFVGAGTGTVTQIQTGTGLSGGPITATGTIAIDTSTQTNITNGATAYSWGNHSSAGYLTNLTSQSIKTLSDVYTNMLPNEGQVLAWDNVNAYWKAVDQTGGGGSGGSSTFLGLTDVSPSEYTNQGGKFVRVNSTANGLEFGEATGENNLAGNVGQGANIYYQKNNSTGMLEFKTIVGGTNITLSEGTTELTINAANISYTGGTGINVSGSNVISVDGSILTTDASPTMLGVVTFAQNPVLSTNLTLDKTLKLSLPAETTKEIFYRSTLSDASNDFFENSNLNATSGVFSPAIRGGVSSSATASGLNFISEIPSNRDSGTVSVMEFISRRGTDVTDYTSTFGTIADISTRPLFEFKNNATSLLKLESTGTTISLGLTVNGNTDIPHNLKFKNNFNLLSGLQSGIDAATYPGCVAVANNDLYYSATSNSGEWIKVADSSLVPTGVFKTISANSGATTANSITDSLTVTGGTDIDTVIVGDTLTINFTGSGGGSGGTTQSLWETIHADSGSTTANSANDALTIEGGNSITTSISGDALTISNDMHGNVHTFDTITIHGGNTIQASGLNNDLIFQGGTDIGISSSGNTITFAYTGTGGGGSGGGTSLAYKTISITGTASQPDVVADSAEDTLTLNAGTGINLNSSGDTITISASGATPSFLDLSDTPGTYNASYVPAVNSAGNGIEFVTKESLKGFAFQNIICPAGTNPSAANAGDTLTFQAGSGISIVGNSTSDTITISTSSTASADFDPRKLASVTYVVRSPGSSAYTMYMADYDQNSPTGTQIGGNNPTLYMISGTTICFDLSNVGSSHPFILKSVNSNTNGTNDALTSGVVHWDGNTTYTANPSSGHNSGYLFLTAPYGTSNNTAWGYQCTSHSAMLGTITVKAIENI